jgi:hypothetical protein
MAAPALNDTISSIAVRECLGAYTSGWPSIMAAGEHRACSSLWLLAAPGAVNPVSAPPASGCWPAKPDNGVKAPQEEGAGGRDCQHGSRALLGWLARSTEVSAEIALLPLQRNKSLSSGHKQQRCLSQLTP